MCRRKYNWKNEVGEKLEDTLNLLISEDDENQFLSLLGRDVSKAFEIILNRQIVIQFIVILETQIDTEILKSLISEFIANNFSNDDIGSLRNPLFSHFRNINSHLETYYDNLVIKIYRSE